MNDNNYKLKNISAYTVVSAAALSVDVSIMYLHYFFYPNGVVYSTALGYLTGAIVSYYLSINFVFKYRKYETNKMLEPCLFFLTGLVGLAITELVMWCGVDVFQINILVSKIVAIGLSFLIVYLFRYRLLFWVKNLKQEEKNG